MTKRAFTAPDKAIRQDAELPLGKRLRNRNQASAGAAADESITRGSCLGRLPGRDFLVVCSVHLKCCGFAGSDEDQLHIDQAEQLAVELNRLRNGDYGDELQNAAIVVIGDYNLVGSRRPLGILESLGLTERILLGQADYAATTWRGRRDEPFWPGRLDVVSFNAKRLLCAR